MSRTRPDPDEYARRTHDTSEEYFRYRVLNVDSTEYLRKIAKVEGAGEARQERIKLINRRVAEVEAESGEQGGASAGNTGEQRGEEAL